MTISREGKATGWSVVAVLNKFPAFSKGACNSFSKEGPYTFAEGVGSHEVFILRDHKRYIPDLDAEEMINLVRAYRERYRALEHQKCVAYVPGFHNHGREAGASLPHPHSQLVAMPVIPADVSRSLRGSERFFHEHGTCVHCEMIQYELRVKKGSSMKMTGLSHLRHSLRKWHLKCGSLRKSTSRILACLRTMISRWSQRCCKSS